MKPQDFTMQFEELRALNPGNPLDSSGHKINTRLEFNKIVKG